MFEREQQFVIKIGEWCNTYGKISATQIRKECLKENLVFDEMLKLISSIKCFKIIPPINSLFRIKVGYKNCWRQTIEKYFEEEIRKAQRSQKEDINLDLDIAEKKRNKWLSIIAIFISIISLLVAIVGICLTVKK